MLEKVLLGLSKEFLVALLLSIMQEFPILNEQIKRLLKDMGDLTE